MGECIEKSGGEGWKMACWRNLEVLESGCQRVGDWALYGAQAVCTIIFGISLAPLHCAVD
jgi:hypothetical protein